MIDVKVVRRLAGQLSWASGLFRQASRLDVPVKRITHALRWVDVALEGIGQTATAGVVRSLKSWTLQTDACPAGMGAVLFKYDKPVE
eukprot:3346650-Amphidinium_carterae.1